MTNDILATVQAQRDAAAAARAEMGSGTPSPERQAARDVRVSLTDPSKLYTFGGRVYTEGEIKGIPTPAGRTEESAASKIPQTIVELLRKQIYTGQQQDVNETVVVDIPEAATRQTVINVVKQIQEGLSRIGQDVVIRRTGHPPMILKPYETGQVTGEVAERKIHISERVKKVGEFEVLDPAFTLDVGTRMLKEGEVIADPDAPAVWDVATGDIIKKFDLEPRPAPAEIEPDILKSPETTYQPTMYMTDEGDLRPLTEFKKEEGAVGFAAGVITSPISLVTTPLKILAGTTKIFDFMGDPKKYVKSAAETRLPKYEAGTVAPSYKYGFFTGQLVGEAAILYGAGAAASHVKGWFDVVSPDIKPLGKGVSGDVAITERFRVGDRERFISKGQFTQLSEGKAFILEDISAGIMGEDVIADVRGLKVDFIKISKKTGEEILDIDTVLGKTVGFQRKGFDAIMDVETVKPTGKSWFGVKGDSIVKHFGKADDTSLSTSLTAYTLYPTDIKKDLRFGYSVSGGISKPIEDMMISKDVPADMFLKVGVDKKGIFKLEGKGKDLFGLAEGDALIFTKMPLDVKSFTGAGKIQTFSLTKPITTGGGRPHLEVFKPKLDFDMSGSSMFSDLGGLGNMFGDLGAAQAESMGLIGVSAGASAWEESASIHPDLEEMFKWTQPTIRKAAGRKKLSIELQTQLGTRTKLMTQLRSRTSTQQQTQLSIQLQTQLQTKLQTRLQTRLQTKLQTRLQTRMQTRQQAAISTRLKLFTIPPPTMKSKGFKEFGKAPKLRGKFRMKKIKLKAGRPTLLADPLSLAITAGKLLKAGKTPLPFHIRSRKTKMKYFRKSLGLRIPTLQMTKKTGRQKKTKARKTRKTARKKKFKWY